MTLQVGDVGIDFSDAAIDPKDSAANGAKFHIRYSAGVGNAASATQHKLCKPGEIQAVIAAGVDFIANSEWYETRVTEGADAGTADGASDLTFWQMRGLAKGAAIYVSWDADPVRAQWRSVDAYLLAYKAALGGYYQLGVYAGTPYLRHAFRKGIADYGWRPNAGSWSNDGLPYQPHPPDVTAAASASPANIWQTGNYWYRNGADEDVIVRAPVGSHLDALAVPTPTARPHPWQRIAYMQQRIARMQARIDRLRNRLRGK